MKSRTEPQTLKERFEKSPQLISEDIINAIYLTEEQKQKLFVENIFQYDLEKVANYNLSATVRDYIEQAFLEHAIHNSLTKEPLKQDTSEEESISHTICNFTCTFKKDKLHITSEDGIDERLTITETDKRALLRCDSLADLLKILRLNEINFGNEVADTLEPYLEQIPLELELLQQINQRFVDKTDINYLKFIKAFRLLERYLDLIDLRALQPHVDNLPQILEQFDWAMIHSYYLRRSKNPQEILDVIIKLSSLEPNDWMQTAFRESLQHLNGFTNNIDFQTLFIESLFKLAKVQHYQQCIKTINASEESKEQGIVIAAAIAQLENNHHTNLTCNFILLKKIIKNPQFASKLYTLFLRLGVCLDKSLLEKILNTEVLNALNELITYYDVGFIVRIVERLVKQFKQPESLGFPLTDLMVAKIDEDHLIDLKVTLSSIYETYQENFVRYYNLYTELTGPGMKLLLEKFGQNYLKEVICNTPDRLFATLKQMPLDCRKVLYHCLGSEEISQHFSKQDSYRSYLQQTSTEEFSFLVEFLEMLQFTQLVSLQWKTTEFYTFLVRVRTINSQLFKNIIFHLNPDRLCATNQTMADLRENLALFDAPIGQLEPFNEVYKKIPDKDYRCFYPNFAALKQDLINYTTTQFSIILEKLGTDHLKTFISDALLKKASLPPEFQCLLVEALGLKKFIQNALENPEDETLFWTKFSHEQYSLDEEKYLVLCLEEELEVLNEPSQMRACALGLIGGLFAFTSHPYKNVQKGMDFMEKAMFLNNSNAMNNLGFIYETSNDELKDLHKAFELYKNAASLNNVVSVNNLGRMYQLGRGVLQDYARAFECYQLGALANHANSIVNLATLYEDGKGVSVNHIEAAFLFRKALAMSCDYSSTFRDSKEHLQNLKQLNLDDKSIQYHYVMALEPKNIKSLLNNSFKFISECILHDALLTDKQKYQTYTECTLDIIPLLNHSPKSIGLCILLDPRLKNQQKYQYFSNSELGEGLFYNILLDYLKVNQEEAEAFCQDAVTYLLELEESGKKYNLAVANCLYYFMALQYDENDDYKEAINYCLKTLNHIPSYHLLAHLLFVNKCGLPAMQRHLLCLHCLQHETTLPTINVRATLISKVLNLLQGRNEFDTKALEKQHVQIESLLKDNETLIQEAFDSVKQWEQRVTLLAHKQMLFFSANKLPKEAKMLVSNHYLELNGL